MLFLPFAALGALAGYVGWQMGKPVSETEIINHFAADYVAATGGAETDCIATPSDVPAARMEITCTGPDGAGLRYVAGPRGGLIDRQELGKVN